MLTLASTAQTTPTRDRPAASEAATMVGLDSETLAMLRLFLAPLMASAPSWGALARQLRDKGYDLAFRHGHLVILNDLGQTLCTGRDVGVPLADLARRIGRPRIVAHRDGTRGALRLAAR